MSIYWKNVILTFYGTVKYDKEIFTVPEKLKKGFLRYRKKSKSDFSKKSIRG